MPRIVRSRLVAAQPNRSVLLVVRVESSSRVALVGAS